ncbi:hypothetical protein HHI36_012001 [Cryptolaemus montrouzieri]|uniref:Peptidase S1 domain-containing protein n=1 Tax=Cryptolaemus montrouzieri TaxID=559131 RepID=A0ABD2NDH4_9CUCU
MKGKTIRAKRFIAHPDFNNDTLDKDIAVIWLEKPMKLKKTVKPILLPEHSERLPKVGTFLTVSGWGVIDSKGNATPAEELRSVQLPLLSKQVCKNCYPELELTDSVFCAGYFLGGRGASFQDSGGPVVYNGKQYGVVSLGGDIDEFPLSPNIFSSVPKLRGFIRRNMGKVFNNTLKE